jgi:hypothetical protein
MKIKQNSGGTEIYNPTERNHTTLNNKHQAKLMHGTKVSAINRDCYIQRMPVFVQI